MNDLPGDAGPPDPPDNTPEPGDARPPSASRAEAQARMAAEDQLPLRGETPTAPEPAARHPDGQPPNEPARPSAPDKPDSSSSHDGDPAHAAPPDTVPAPPEHTSEADHAKPAEAHPAPARPTEAQARLTREDHLPLRGEPSPTPHPDRNPPDKPNPTPKPNSAPDAVNAPDNGERPAKAPQADARAPLDASTEPATRPGKAEKASDVPPGEYPVTVHNADGTNVPIIAEYLPSEARTIGDTAPTGIGRKPSGEDFLDMETDNPAKRRIDRLFDEALKEGDDFSDAVGHIGASAEADLQSGPGPSGHPGSYHAASGSAQDHPAPSDPGMSDAMGSMAIVGVMVAIAIRRTVLKPWKEHKP